MRARDIASTIASRAGREHTIMTDLYLRGLDAADHLGVPHHGGPVGLGSPARRIFIDYRAHEPRVIDSWMRATDARRHMLQTHEPALLVVDADGVVVGAVLADDLGEDRLIRHIAAGARRDEIRVFELMTPRHAIRAIAHDDFEHATVRDVLVALRSHGERFCLIVDHRNHEIRGLVAARIVAQRLSVGAELDSASTFVDVFRAIHH
jgi:CBS domain containing-hemolysin-like protein